MSEQSSEPLVAMLTEQGFRVYAPARPQETFLVTGTGQAPSCTCPEFEQGSGDNDFRCRHILAVESQLPQGQPGEEVGSGAEEFPPATQPEPQMVLKRSVSPDGRIDSLSVEFALPLDSLTAGQIKERARKTLVLQDEIVGAFLSNHNAGACPSGNGHSHDTGHNGYGDQAEDQNGAVPARLVDVRGMNTRRGWTLFINVQAGRQSFKLFGDRKALGEAIRDAGYPDLAHNVNAGLKLDIPCRVTIRPTEDGRYQNVEQVWPAENGQSARRGR